MTDVSFAAMGLLMGIGLLLAALKAVSLTVSRAFIYAGAGVLCAHAIGLKVVAPISASAADTLDWISLVFMFATLALLAGRGLVRTVKEQTRNVTN